MNTSDTLEICSNIEKILEQFGNINFLSKEDLYLLIDYIRDSFNIDIDNVFNVPYFCKNYFKDIIEYDFHKFNDIKIGGFLIKNRFPDKSFITVNASKEPISTIFDLTHEMIHFLLHPEDRKHYISSSLCDIDNFEWQANEGAAELLVPYKRFIPYFTNNIKNCKSREDYLALLSHLSDKYTVSTSVLEYRISSLKYEINQYQNGTPIDKIKFLSKRAQEEQGIFIEPYSNIFKKEKTELRLLINQFSSKNSFSSSNSTTCSVKPNEWKAFLNDLKASGKIMLYAHLINTELLQIDKNTVGISFPYALTNSRKSILEKGINIELLKQQINMIFKKEMNIKFIEKSFTA